MLRNVSTLLGIARLRPSCPNWCRGFTRSLRLVNMIPFVSTVIDSYIDDCVRITWAFGEGRTKNLDARKRCETESRLMRFEIYP